MSSFTVRTRHATGEARFVVRETESGLDVWAQRGAPGQVATGLATFLNGTATGLSASEVRAMLAPVSDLPAVPDVEERAS